MSLLSDIQQKLKAPKSNTNSFGGYKYRSCEDILEAVKPLLGDSTLIISDEITEVGGRVYVKATATLYECQHSSEFKGNVPGVKWEATAWAREAETKKGMDEAQITGSASSYARKYALNGLFLIDDTKDADTMDNKEGKPENKANWKIQDRMINEINNCKDRTALVAWHSDIEVDFVGLPEDIVALVMEQYENRLKQMDSGIAKPQRHKYNGSTEMDEDLRRWEPQIVECQDQEQLENWKIKNAHRIAGMDKARKDKLGNIYNKRLIEINPAAGG